ncbi:hypothetical protein AABE10_35220 [Paraburkholderia diazotrophica]
MPLNFSQLQKALDDVTEIFIKTARNLESTAKLRLEQYRMRHADELQTLVCQFRDVLQILQDDETPAAVCLASHARSVERRFRLGAGPVRRANRADGNHTFPFLLAPYQNLRSLLFRCVAILSLKSNSQDDALLKAFDWLEQYRSSWREYLLLSVQIRPSNRVNLTSS